MVLGIQRSALAEDLVQEGLDTLSPIRGSGYDREVKIEHSCLFDHGMPSSFLQVPEFGG